MIGTCINENVLINVCNFKCNTCEYFVKGFEEKALVKICIEKDNSLNNNENFNEYIENIKKATEKVEEKQYLKTWEAIKALEEGKKVRKNSWEMKEYIYLDKYGNIIQENGSDYELDCIYKEDEWEIYEKVKKEMPKEFEGLKYLLASINNMNCDKQNCDNCPLGIDNCNTLDDIFFDVKQNYNF